MVSRVVALTLLACLAVSVTALDPYGHQPHKGFKKHPPKPYAFSYGVDDPHYGPRFSQDEKSDGNTVKGSYSVQLPDGRLQTVTYTADHHNGFFADVSYKGKAQFPSKPQGPPFIVKAHGGGGGYH